MTSLFQNSVFVSFYAKNFEKISFRWHKMRILDYLVFIFLRENKLVKQLFPIGVTKISEPFLRYLFKIAKFSFITAVKLVDNSSRSSHSGYAI